MFPIPTSRSDPEYLDAFLQGAHFALFALEGRLDDGGAAREVDDALGELHDLFSTTRTGIEAREASLERIERYIGKN